MKHKDETSLFSVLGDPTRREIIRMLRAGSRGAGEIADAFALSKPTLSHHFAVLRAAGLLRAERQGTRIVYTLQSNAVHDLTAAVFELFGAPAHARKESS
jgi:DNA-binding transcriptional ArsR family regulator